MWKKGPCSSQGEALSENENMIIFTDENVREDSLMAGSEISDFSAVEALPWWAVYTRHQHEKQVADTLEAKGYDVLLPMYSSLRRWKDRRKLISVPLFPGYVFVRGCRERRLGIVSTPGVHMVLTRGDAAAEIPEEEILAIRRTLEAKFAVEPHPFLNCGDRVRVMRGALEGVEGILVRKKNIFRLILSVDMLAQSVAVEINATDVQPVRKGPRPVDVPNVAVGRSWELSRPNPVFRVS
jgi:transcription antitermination factor NusG